jgi:hypothetical protein
MSPLLRPLQPTESVERADREGVDVQKQRQRLFCFTVGRGPSSRYCQKTQWNCESIKLRLQKQKKDKRNPELATSPEELTSDGFLRLSRPHAARDANQSRQKANLISR